MNDIVIILSIINAILLISLLVVLFVFIKKIKALNNSNIENKSQDYKDENVEENTVKKKVFDSDTLDIDSIELFNTPVELHDFIANINKMIDKQKYKSISAIKIVKWLVLNGYIKEVKTQVIKEIVSYSVTEKGEDIGIICKNTIDKQTNEGIPSYLLNKKAQQYILNELVNIYDKGSSNTFKSKKSRENVGARWTVEEDDQLLDEYLNKKLKISEIAKIHGRKSSGIKARLKKKHGIEI